MYRPIQPGVTNRLIDLELHYQEFPPHPALQPYIHCYWCIRSSDTLVAPLTYRVIPDGCVDILMDVLDDEGMLVATTMQAPAYVPFTGQTHYIGIRFLPGCAGIFLDIPLPDLLDEMVLMEDAQLQHDEALEACLLDVTDMPTRIQKLDQYFIGKLDTLEQTSDRRVLAALKVIYQTQGNPASDCLSNITSSRHLRRLFHKHTGVSPKVISRIVRFQTLIRAILQAPEKHHSHVDIDFGYYDQSHFIREFKSLYGETPGRFLRSLQPPA
ncbi:MAG: helix-turn-helix domain-containing protein [Pseudomonadota bacterium]